MTLNAIRKLVLISVPHFTPKKSSSFIQTRFISTSPCCYSIEKDKKHQLSVMDHYFKREENKNKKTFVNLVDLYKKKNFKTGHVEFVYCAMKRMYDFGVNEDLEVYKQIIDVMPKGKMVATNFFQAETLYYPKHQMAITDLLVQMEENDVMPDRDMHELLLSIFGDRSQPIKKYYRMMYWLPKFKNASPWLLPKPVPRDPLALSKLAMSRMCSIDPQSEIEIFRTKELEDDTENTWIVNGTSPTQRRLLAHHPIASPIYLEGGFKIYLRKSAITYFVLRADVPENRRKKSDVDEDVIKNLKIPFFDHPDRDTIIPNRSVHEQNDGIIYAVAATGTSSKNSLLSWLRLLEKHGFPNIHKIPIIFRTESPLGVSVPIVGIEGGEKMELIQSS